MRSGSAGASLSNEELFRKAFADRFASLDSLVSSSHESDAGCAPCAAVLAQPPVGRQGSQYQLGCWLLFGLAIVALLCVFYCIYERMRKRDASKHRHHPRASVLGSHMGHAALPTHDASHAPAKGKDVKPVEVLLDAAAAKKTQGNRLLVVFMHANWCGHCKQTLPEFEAVASKYHEHADFKTVESAVLKDAPIVTEVGLQGYPTTLFVRGNDILEIKVGGYKRDALVSLVEKFLKA